MRTLLNPLMTLNKFEKLFTEPGEYELTILPGRYTFVKRGGGGAGGTNGTTSGGKAGSGGKGKIDVNTIIITETTNISVYVGNGGLTYANGGNGGSAGGRGGRYNPGSPDTVNGCGGGGGEPSYIKIGDTYYYADGGGGGGGGGSGASMGRYSGGAPGGGGGGLYKFSNGEMVSVPGQVGGNGGAGYSVNGQAGTSGNTTDYPDIKSGNGSGWNHPGGAAASGGGASGGGGGYGAGNETDAWGGGSGGGAGGDDDAGGGTGGAGNGTGGSASNPHTTPTDTAAENTQYGVVGNYGIGGTTNTNGTPGFVLIRRVAWA